MKTLPSKSCLWHLNHFVKNYYPMYQSNGDMIENCLFFITMISRDKSRKEKVLTIFVRSSIETRIIFEVMVQSFRNFNRVRMNRLKIIILSLYDTSGNG